MALGWRDLPVLFRHSVIAIHGKMGGNGADSIIRAMRIARDTLAKSGYLFPAGSFTQVLEGIHLTGKGWKRNQQHLREGFANGAKDRAFEALFKEIEPQLYDLEGKGGQKIDQPAGDNREAKLPPK